MVGTGKKTSIPVYVKLSGFVGLILTCFIIAYVLFTQPTWQSFPRSVAEVNTDRLRAHVEKLSNDFAPRNYKRIWNLNKCADYIKQHFALTGGMVTEQAYEVKGTIFRNVIVSFGPEDGTRMVVGAHYDSFRDSPGADDNASGVAGLIELAGLLGSANLKQRVDLVAYTLEEPPFFRSGNMGSARHAYDLRTRGVDLEVMICLEMIGYFNDEPGSQRYSSTFQQLCYPDSGNYIGVIGSISDRKFVRKMKAVMRGATDLPVQAMCAPRGHPGIDFSDHRSYWKQGYNAVIITDTAFMRNFAYHGPEDTADRLDFDRMGKVVLGVYEAVMHFSNNQS